MEEWADNRKGERNQKQTLTLHSRSKADQTAIRLAWSMKYNRVFMGE
jgi:hypothetical protein